MAMPSKPTKPVEVTFITKPGCHLCDEARPILHETVAELQAEGYSVEVTELDMLSEEKLTKKYSEDIPVVLIAGRRHSFWHVDPAKLRQAVIKKHPRR